MMILLVISLLISSVFGNPAWNNPMINEGLFEGDILGVDPYRDRNAVPDDWQLWPEGVIPYEIQDSVTSDKSKHDLVLKGMKQIEDATCVKFVPKKPTDNDYVSIFQGVGCYANWGRIGGKQMLSLGPLCYYLGTVVHELMHVMGFEHEHNRGDRDEYVDILWENIDEEWYPAFRKLTRERRLTPFDFDSVLLYGQSSFAKFGLQSMRAKDGRFMEEPYNKPGLSASDIVRVKMLYKCKK